MMAGHLDESRQNMEHEHEGPEHGPGRLEHMTSLLANMDLEGAYEAFQAWDNLNDEDFTGLVETITGASVTSCDHCGDVIWSDDATWTQGGDESICESCCDRHYSQCSGCSDYVSNGNRQTYEYESYCESCFDNTFAYCEHCDEYVYAEDHDFDHEDEQCECEAPHLWFDFPANGHGTIREDERLTVQLPAGTIDDEGLRRILNIVIAAVREQAGRPEWPLVPSALEEIGTTWQTKRGNFTRRLSSALYSRGVKLPDGVLAEVGNIARAHSSGDASWDVEVTRDLNLSAEDFYHDSSCWWGGYSYSRCALKQWGGLALRTFTDVDRSYRPWDDGGPFIGPLLPVFDSAVTGRAWVQPVRLVDDTIRPTHDVTGADGYVVYNGYGDLDGYTAVRIVAHLASMTYRRISLSIERQYVNGNTGYLVASEDTCQAIAGAVWNMDEHDHADARTFHRCQVSA